MLKPTTPICHKKEASAKDRQKLQRQFYFLRYFHSSGSRPARPLAPYPPPALYIQILMPLAVAPPRPTTHPTLPHPPLASPRPAPVATGWDFTVCATHMAHDPTCTGRAESRHLQENKQALPSDIIHQTGGCFMNKILLD